MKTKIIKGEPAIQKLRQIRDKVSLEIKDMTYEQLKQFLEKQKGLHPLSAWRKQQ